MASAFRERGREREEELLANFMELFGQWGSRGRGGVEQGGTGSSCSCNFYTFRAVGPGSHFILQHRSEHPALLRMALINPPTHDPRKSYPPPPLLYLFTIHFAFIFKAQQQRRGRRRRRARVPFPFPIRRRFWKRKISNFICPGWERTKASWRALIILCVLPPHTILHPIYPLVWPSWALFGPGHGSAGGHCF